MVEEEIVGIIICYKYEKKFRKELIKFSKNNIKMKKTARKKCSRCTSRKNLDPSMICIFL